MRGATLVTLLLLPVAFVAGGCGGAGSGGGSGSSTPHVSTPRAGTGPDTHGDTGLRPPGTTSTSPGPAPTPPPSLRLQAAVLDHVVDGDTIALTNGHHVRLLQVDTPEVHGSVECYGPEANRLMHHWLAPGDRVWLEADPRLDRVDAYGRLLRYVRSGSRGLVNLNLRLVRVGAASVWYYDGVRGRYATQLDRLVASARSHHRGLWGRCPGTGLDTTHGVETGRHGQPPPQSGSSTVGGSGERFGPTRIAGYSHGLPMIPPPPPDLDCSDLPGPVWVGPSDPHRLDADGDGVGCDA